jgi:hypothetical protein
MLTYDEVTELASDMGRSNATWVKVLETLSPPSWLSGEWAGESMAEILALTGDENDDDVDDMASHFEEVADSAYWSEIERVCLFHTTED